MELCPSRFVTSSRVMPCAMKNVALVCCENVNRIWRHRDRAGFVTSLVTDRSIARFLLEEPTTPQG